MTEPTSSKPRPSLWAVTLLVVSSAFAVVSIGLFSASYAPF